LKIDETDNNILIFYESTEKSGNLCIKCTYNILNDTYTEYCWNKNKPEIVKSKSWKRLGFIPVFGIDEIDWIHSYKVADELGKEFDLESNSN
jgi:hypothetical protein